MSGEERSLPLPFEPTAAPVWIDAATVAGLAGISEQKTRQALAKCAAGGTWRQHALKVRTKDGGPASAQNPYLVHVDSLPPALAGAYYERAALMSPPVDVKVGAALDMPEKVNPRAAKDYAELEWKLKILAPALEFAEGTPGRAEWLRELAKRTHTGPDGKPRRFALRTLQEWITRIKKAQSALALLRKPREEKPSRNIICRLWDSACPLPLDAKWSIEREIQAYVRSLWAKGMGWTQIEELASSQLLEASRAAGWAAAAYTQCRVGRHYVQKHSETKILAVKTGDAKRWHDEFVPRIQRTREGLRPGDIVVGDVHPVDVIVLRADGSEATFRLIAWLDIATGDIFGTLVLFEPNKSVTQAHIAASFAAMVQAWGLPRLLMLDNGKEYSWGELERGFRELAMLANGFKAAMRFMVREEADATPFMDEPEDSIEARETPILRALPHRPASKPIEGIFAVLERLLFKHFPGWIGGDRMNKKTHQMGKAPKPFPGSQEAFEALFFDAMSYWRTRARKSLGGRSVNEVRDAFQRDGGALPPDVPLQALVFALSETMTRNVVTRGIEVGGVWYRSPATLKYTGQKVTVRYAKWAPDYIFMMADASTPLLVGRAPVFGYADGEGARHQADMDRILNAHVRELKATTRPIDPLAEMSRHVAAVGKDVPVLKGPAIALSDELQSAVEAAKLPPPENDPLHLGYGEVLDRKTGEIVRAFPDHYTARHQPAEEDDEPDWAEVAKRFAQKERLDEDPPSSSPDAVPRPNGTER
ncbi:MAG TPA: hypothetical protein DCL01_12600 [Thauera sp.]|nr:hypothetical protein [Thauera sp.]HHW62455.1 transposase [Rhodocyclaceae bacterium]